MEMNLQLHHVVSDITCVTGRKIMRAIVAGDQDLDVWPIIVICVFAPLLRQSKPRSMGMIGQSTSHADPIVRAL